MLTICRLSWFKIRREGLENKKAASSVRAALWSIVFRHDCARPRLASPPPSNHVQSDLHGAIHSVSQKNAQEDFNTAKFPQTMAAQLYDLLVYSNL
jgi:hypothetical protein